MSKSIDTLVDDIYKVLQSKEPAEGVDLEAEVEVFSKAMKKLMTSLFTVHQKSNTLRMSNIGRRDRYLWNVVNRPDMSEEFSGHTLLKFMFGHVIEEMLLFLTRVSGHEVTDEQKYCEVGSVRGSMDCRIDGVVTDVKSVSSYGYKKFKDGSLAQDDPFGYIGQIKGYANSQGETQYGWLAMDKQNGHLTYLLYDEEDAAPEVAPLIGYNIAERVEHVKAVVASETPPEPCYEPVPDGKSGNMKLAVGCSYCQYKTECWPGLRAYLYSGGPRFLTEVKNEPKVPEIPLVQL